MANNENVLDITDHQGMQIKTAVRYYFIPVGMAKKKKKKKRQVRIWNKGKPCAPVNGNVNWCSYCGKDYANSSKFFRKEV